MSNRKSKQSQDDFGFQDAAKKHFSFLISEYGFWISRSDPQFVEYKGKKVYFEICRSHKANELDFVIGLLPNDLDNKYKLPMDFFYHLMNKNLMDEHKEIDIHPSTSEAVENSIRIIADHIRKYADKALAGDISYFSKVLVRVKIADNFGNIYYGGLPPTAKKAAKKAWDAGNFDALFKIYEKFESDLDKGQKECLEFIRTMKEMGCTL